MSDSTDTPAELTEAQQAQHNYVLGVAHDNLKLVLDQVASLAGPKMYDDIITNLEAAKSAFEKELN